MVFSAYKLKLFQIAINLMKGENMENYWQAVLFYLILFFLTWILSKGEL
jgi:hypothetical protein